MGARIIFQDRADAGRFLGHELMARVGSPRVVAAIARGGVPVAIPVAHELSAPLTVLRVARLTVPYAPEAAFGALDEDGRALIEYARIAGMRITAEEIESAKAQAWETLQRAAALWGSPPALERFAGSAVVIVDDGMATGFTMHAAVSYARAQGAEEITVAVPCASTEAAGRIRGDIDRLVCPNLDDSFRAFADYYREFPRLSDQEVVALLAAERNRPAPGSGSPPAPSTRGS